MRHLFVLFLVIFLVPFASADLIEVIVTYESPSPIRISSQGVGALEEISSAHNAKVVKESSPNRAVLTISPQELDELKNNPLIQSVSENIRVTSFLDASRPHIGVDDVWNLQIEGNNITGKGYAVCVIDSGIDYTHDAFGACSSVTSTDEAPDEISFETAHPYSSSINQNETITMEGYDEITIFFDRIHLARHSSNPALDDIITIYDGSDNPIITYRGRLESFWSPTIAGDTLTVNIRSLNGASAFGYEITHAYNGSINYEWDCPKIVDGFNFLTNTSEVMPITDNHGTHVGGIVGGNGSENKGVAKEVTLLSAVALDEQGDGLFSDVTDAFEWCMDKKEDYDLVAISMSLGGGLFSNSCDGDYPSLANMVTDAVSENISVVIATGNSGSSSGVAAPACLSNTIRVGSTIVPSDSISSFTDRGANFSILMAPGSSITSTILENGYGSLSGTSMATPHVSGVIALLQQQRSLLGLPYLTPSEVFDRLNSTGVEIDDTGGSGVYYSRIDAFEALSYYINIEYSVEPEQFGLGDIINISWNISSVYPLNQTESVVALFYPGDDFVENPSELSFIESTMGSFQAPINVTGEYGIVFYVEDTNGFVEQVSENFTIRIQPDYNVSFNGVLADELNFFNDAFFVLENTTLLIETHMFNGSNTSIIINDDLVNNSFNASYALNISLFEEDEFNITILHEQTDHFFQNSSTYFALVDFPELYLGIDPLSSVIGTSNISVQWMLSSLFLLTEEVLTTNLTIKNPSDQVAYYNDTLFSLPTLYEASLNDSVINQTGIYNATLFVEFAQRNYSVTQLFNITKNIPQIQLLLDGVPENISADEFVIINISANRLFGDGNLSLSINDVEINNSESNFSVEYNFSTPGLHIINLTTLETEFFESQSLIKQVEVFSIPELNLSQIPQNDSFIGINTPFIINASNEYGDLLGIQYSIDQDAWINISADEEFFPFNNSSDSGDVEIIFRAQGQSAFGGFIANTSSIYEYKLDLTPPTIMLISDLTNIKQDDFELNFSVNNTYGESLSHVYYRINNRDPVVLYDGVPPQNFSEFSETVNFSVGNNRLTLFANDTFSNAEVYLFNVLRLGLLNVSEKKIDLETHIPSSTISFKQNNTLLEGNINISEVKKINLSLFIEQNVETNLTFFDVNTSSVFWENNPVFNFSLAQRQNLTNVITDEVLAFTSLFYQHDFIPDTDIITITHNISPSDYNIIYRIVGEYELEKVNQCSQNNISLGSLPCFENTSQTLSIGLDQFSSYVVGLDQTPPTVQIAAPNGTPQRLFTPTLIISNDVLELEDVVMNYSGEIESASEFDFFNETHRYAYFTEKEENHGEEINISFTVTDSAGNINDTESIQITINDTVPPVLTVINPQNTTYTTQTVPINVTLDQPGTVQYRINDESSLTSLFQNQTSGSSSITGLSNGQTNLTIIATDLGGNINETLVVFTRNYVPPQEDDDDDDENVDNGGGDGGFPDLPPDVTPTEQTPQLQLGANEYLFEGDFNNSVVINTGFSINSIKIFSSLFNQGVSVLVREYLDGEDPPILNLFTGPYFKIIEFDVQNLPSVSIDEIQFNFTVTEQWLNSNGLTPQDVNLYRYSSQRWSELPTEYVGFNNVHRYTATSPGFSFFAIGVLEEEEIIITSTDDTEDDDVDDETIDSVIEDRDGSGMGYLYLILLGFLISGVGAYFFVKNKKPKLKKAKAQPIVELPEMYESLKEEIKQAIRKGHRTEAIHIYNQMNQMYTSLDEDKQRHIFVELNDFYEEINKIK